MRRLVPVLAALAACCSPLLAQDLQPKGVSYYGRPAARKLYTQPIQPGVTGRPDRRTGRSGTSHDFTQAIMSGGVPRQFIVHLPANFNPRNRTPVIFMFHGLHMNGGMMPPLTGMNGAADRYGFVVVYPTGVGNRWADGVQPSSVDDVAFVGDILSYLASNFAVDTAHVYAAGLSNGGYFAQRLACQMPGRIAAVAVVASGAIEGVCNSCAAGAVPIMYFLGTEDALVPREGKTKSLGKLGEMVGLGDLGLDSLTPEIARVGGVLGAEDAVEFWVRHNGAGGASTTLMPDTSPRDGCRVKREIYGAGRREVDVYTIEGGGHSWPGGLPVMQGVLGRTTGDINASDLICQFFRSH